MRFYLVWDFDPMDGSMGKEYLAATYRYRRVAERAVAKRNAGWRAYWVKQCGEARAQAEPWNWRHARLEERDMK